MSPLELPVIDTAEKALVMARLDEVLDPELDQSVTSMGFIESVAVEGGVVDVAFRLPTFWCSANFAFLMAVDMKSAIEQLDWVEEARIRLVDHFAARKINEGVARSASTKCSQARPPPTFPRSAGCSARRPFSAGRPAFCGRWRPSGAWRARWR
jgi:metal-sulfur cluster biosynthetic enzyme